jgi:hypothetical protein
MLPPLLLLLLLVPCWELLLIKSAGDWSHPAATSSSCPSHIVLRDMLSPIAMEKRRWRKRCLMLLACVMLLLLCLPGRSSRLQRRCRGALAAVIPPSGELCVHTTLLLRLCLTAWCTK